MSISLKHNNHNKRHYTIIVAIVLFSVSVFSQTNKIEVLQEVSVTVSNTSVSKSSNVEFILWFMGTKQSPSPTILNEWNSTRNEVLSSGLAPNRLLIKALLKKAVNFETTLG